MERGETRNVILWILLFLPHYCKSQYCPTQTSTHSGSLITWYSSEPKEAISHPPCINNNNEITRRTCTPTKTWLPPNPPPCKMTQQIYQPSCPPDFITIADYCIFVSKPQQWTSKCPFPNGLNIGEPQNVKILSQLGLDGVWLPVRRNQPFGKFVWTFPRQLHTEYEHIFLQKALKEEEDIYDCIIINRFKVSDIVTYETKIVSCNSRYKQVCLYHTNNTLAPSNQEVACSNSRANICYTLAHETHSKQNDYCTKLATPTTTLENQAIKSLLNNDICWIGLGRDRRGSFQWTNPWKQPEYTDWMISTNFTKPFVGISQAGWNLFNDYSLNCAVCETDVRGREISLKLVPNYKNGSLILTIYSPSYFINENKITCGVVGFNDIGIKFSSKNAVKRSYDSDKILNELSRRDDRHIYILHPNTKDFNYYMCQGIILPNSTVISSEKVLFGTKRVGREYALRILVKNICGTPKKCDPLYDDNYEDILESLKDKTFNRIRIMKILSVQNRSLEVVLHVRIEENDMTLLEEYNKVYELFHKNLRTDKIIFISLKSCLGCLPETTLNQNMSLDWDFAAVGTTTTSKNLCLGSDGLPVTRKCSGDFLVGANWEKEIGECSQNVNFTPVTKNLHELYLNHQNHSTEEIITKLENLTNSVLSPGDIYYISQILSSLNLSSTNSNYLAKSMVTILNNLIATDITTLRLSNQLLNSTNTVLYIFEQLMEQFEDLELDEDGLIQFVTPNLFYQVSDVSFNNITGVAMIRQSKSKSFTDFEFKALTSDTRMEELLEVGNLEIATFIPDIIIDKMNNTNSTRVFIGIFYNSSLFVEDQPQEKVIGSHIISVSILGYDNYLSSPLPVIFNISRKSKDPRCSYWSFGHSVYEDTYPTKWASDGGIHWNLSNENLEICAFTHLTHFALLLGDSDPPWEEEIDLHDQILSIITITGCSLSIFGVSAIILTTVLFPSWRQKSGTKVLLNLSFSILLQMLVLFFSDTENFPRSSTNCILFGVILHYATISSFAWMLVVAFLQYLRFVKVVGGTPPRLLFKSCMVGWVLPALPVLTLLIWDPNNYTPMSDSKSTGLCYPHGISLYTSVLLPIVLIILFNLSIFFLVLYNVTHTTLPKRSRNNNMLSHQLKLMVLLFFILGLTWIFGLLTKLVKSIVFLYLFCCTATMQGFVLFVFYVLLDTNTRKLWISFLKPYFRISKRKMDTSLQNSNSPDVQQNTSESGANTNVISSY